MRVPEEHLRVNGFRRVRGGEYFVEWRDVSRDRIAKVWVMFETTPSHTNGWLVEYEVTDRRGNRIIESATISEHPGEDANGAIESAVAFMREHGSGAGDMSGGLGDFDFTGGL